MGLGTACVSGVQPIVDLIFTLAPFPIRNLTMSALPEKFLNNYRSKLIQLPGLKCQKYRGVPSKDAVCNAVSILIDESLALISAPRSRRILLTSVLSEM